MDFLLAIGLIGSWLIWDGPKNKHVISCVVSSIRMSAANVIATAEVEEVLRRHPHLLLHHREVESVAARRVLILSYLEMHLGTVLVPASTGWTQIWACLNVKRAALSAVMSFQEYVVNVTLVGAVADLLVPRHLPLLHLLPAHRVPMARCVLLTIVAVQPSGTAMGLIPKQLHQGHVKT